MNFLIFLIFLNIFGACKVPKPLDFLRNIKKNKKTLVMQGVLGTQICLKNLRKIIYFCNFYVQKSLLLESVFLKKLVFYNEKAPKIFLKMFKKIKKIKKIKNLKKRPPPLDASRLAG